MQLTSYLEQPKAHKSRRYEDSFHGTIYKKVIVRHLSSAL